MAGSRGKLRSRAEAPHAGTETDARRDRLHKRAEPHVRRSANFSKRQTFTASPASRACWPSSGGGHRRPELKKIKSVQRYDDPALPLACKISLIEPAQHCDRLRGEPRASTHAMISPDAAGRPARIIRSRFDLDPCRPAPATGAGGVAQSITKARGTYEFETGNLSRANTQRRAQ